MKLKLFIQSGLFAVLFTIVNFAWGQVSWQQYVKEIRQQALVEGIRPEVFDQAFRDIHAPDRKVLFFDRTQPEKRITFMHYRDTRADNSRINLGRQEFRQHQAVLERIGSEYGVDPCFIVSLWGLETSYGRFMGNFPVIKSLATLGYDNRRSDFFRSELLIALHMVNDGQVSLHDFKGEWAGASGHPQFMPSTWRDYAVDYTGSGRKDIWHNLNDVFASVANFLVKNGWKRGEPWAILVNVPDNFDRSLIANKVTKSVDEWMRLGVRPISNNLPDGQLMASIIFPDGGPAFMIFNNFKVLKRWNNSNYYVGTVGYLANQICQRR